jgi:hypothetical protein
MAAVRRVWMATIAVIFGLSAGLGVGSPAWPKSVTASHTQCAKAAGSKAKHAKRGPKCKKSKPTRHRPTPPEAPSATIVVHVSSVGTIPVRQGADCAEEGLEEGVRAKRPGGGEVECDGDEVTTRRPEEGLPLRITRLGARRETLETSEHTVHVAPGLYEIALNHPSGVYKKQEVTVSKGQTVEVRLLIVDEG